MISLYGLEGRYGGVARETNMADANFEAGERKGL